MEPRFAARALQPATGASTASDVLDAPVTGRSRFAPDRPLLLALAVHWDDCSVAIGSRASIVTEVWSAQPDRSSGGSGSAVASRDALLLLDRLLVKTGTALSAVTQLCFARGPGAFTSLRVAAGLVQGLSLATSIPIAGICSLAALVAHEPGWNRGDDDEADEPAAWLQLAALDARMGECYFGVQLCRRGRHPSTLLEPAVGSPARAVAAFEQALAQHPGVRLVPAGNGFRLLPELAGLAARIGHDPETVGARAPTAAAVLAVAASTGAPKPGPARTALPIYVRDKIALDVTEQRAHAAARANAGAVAARSGS